MRYIVTGALTLAAALFARADGDVPVTVTPLSAQSLTTSGTSATVDLSTHFTLPGVSGQVMQITTTQGYIFAELLPSAAPNTVTNFLSYVNDGSYNSSVIHRAESGFVIQGGGFKFNSSLTAITAKTAVANEYNLPNTRGTLSMAKPAGSPNGATDQWFINLSDNTTSLGTSNNGGYTVFARVVGNGMAVADTIGSLPTTANLTSLNAALSELPVQKFLPGQTTVYLPNLVAVTSITSAPAIYPTASNSLAILSFNVQNSNPAVVTATLKGSILTLKPGKTAGIATITVGDYNNTFPDTSFVVTISAPTTTAPAGQTVMVNQTATFSTTPAAIGSTYQWQRKAAGSTTWVSLAETDPYAGTTGATLTVNPATISMSGDAFQCLVTTSGITATRTGAILTVVPTPLPRLALQQTYLSGAIPALDVSGGSTTGLVYYAAGLPKGLSINASTGQITGTPTASPGTYVIQYWSQNGKIKSAVQSAIIVVNSLPLPMVNGFENLLLDTNGLPVGKLELRVSYTGAFTGKLTCGDTQVYALRGQLALSSDYSTGSVTLSLKRSAAPSTPFSLTLNVSTSSTLSSALTQQNPNTSPTSIGSASSTDSALLPPLTTTGFAWSGTYTLALADPTNLDSTPLNFATTPAGIGYAAVSIPSTGAMVLKGKTADGTPFTASLASAYDASYRAYIKPYKTAGGYLAGWLDMTQRSDYTSTKPVYHIASATSSDFYWFKPASATDKAYPQGFGPVGLDVSAEPWSASTSLAGTFPLTISEAGISNSGANSDQLPSYISLTSKYVAAVASPSNLANPSKWTLKVASSTGAFTGSFVVQRTVNGKATNLTVPIEGVLQQPLSPATATPFAQGYILLPPNTTTGATTVSGAIQLSTP